MIEAPREEHASPTGAPEDAGLPGTEADRRDEALGRHLRGRPMPTDPKALQRIGMFLVRRGFDPRDRAVDDPAAASDGDEDGG